MLESCRAGSFSLLYVLAAAHENASAALETAAAAAGPRLTRCHLFRGEPLRTRVRNITTAFVRAEAGGAAPPGAVRFLPLSDVPIGLMDSAELDWGDIPEHFWDEMAGGFLRGRPLPSSLFAWKNSLFVASAAAIRRHPKHTYESALRYVQEHGGKCHGFQDVAGAFERCYTELFGDPSCAGKWTNCASCAVDCGPCTAVGDTVQCG